MRDGLPYQYLADAVLTLHFGLVTFVVSGLVFIVAGNVVKWRWVNSFWFRITHLAAIGIVVAEAWLDAACPLTSLEMWLRARAHETGYSGSFVEHWVQRVLYYEAPSWVFVFAYSLFGFLVAAAWFYFPPASGRRGNDRDA